MGYGLTELATRNLITSFVECHKCQRALEFGSGDSTSVLHYHFHSVLTFDHNEKHAYKGTADGVDLRIRPLIYYDEANYERAYKLRSLSAVEGLDDHFPDEYVSFYKLKPSDLSGVYDYVLLDGPFHLGRALAFPAVYNYVRPGTVIFIDDLHHYEFEAQAGRLWDLDMIVRRKEDDHKGHGIFKIKGVRDG